MSYVKASFLEEFEIPEITQDTIRAQLVKITKNRSVIKNKSIENLPLEEKLKVIKDEVDKVLGRYKGFVKVIYDTDELDKYADKIIECGYLALDTETNRSLDPLTCKLMGICAYIPNTRPVYIPINHIDNLTGLRLSRQINEEQASRVFKRIKDAGTKVIYHNGKFDIRVLKNTLGFYMSIWWDTMLASQMLDENEQAKLKYQFKKHINPTIGSYNIEKLFSGIPYESVDPEIFALYAAIDPYDTYKLQQYQQKIFEQDGLENMYNLFLNIEVPTTLVVAHMEEDGISVNLDFIDKLNKKYNKGLNDAVDKLYKILEPYKKEISIQQELDRLDNPLNFNSADQLKILMYEIMKVEVPDGVEKGTDKDTLKLINNDFTKTLLTYRHYYKAITSFTEPITGFISEKDGKIHAKFNQMGTEENNVRTGRFSSTRPNLQQIPSKGDGKEMRLMFCASTEYRDRSVVDNTINLSSIEEVETERGWLFAKDLLVGDIIKSDNENLRVVNINKNSDNYIITLKEV